MNLMDLFFLWSSLDRKPSKPTESEQILLRSNFGLDYHTFQHMVGDCPHDFLQLAFNCCNMDPKLRPVFPDIVKSLEQILTRLKLEEMEQDADDKNKTINKVEKGFKRLNPHGFEDGKIPPKSPRPRRNIWLSRSQSDVFSCKPGRKVNVQDPYYHPPLNQRTAKSHKINPFTAREDLCGGKIKFFDVPTKSVFSLVFDLHSPPGSVFCKLQANANNANGPVAEGSYSWQQLPGRQCHSVPVSPRLPRSFHLSTAAAAAVANNCGSVTCDANQPPSTAVNSRADAVSTLNDPRQRSATVSGWAKKYVVVEIPPFCRRRGSEEGHGGEDSEGEEEEGGGWSPMPQSEKDSTEAMDCSSIDDAEAQV
ncbi:hypothetical protein WMY93_000615 [Mugilogobius chulae]|uniref:Serine-threonine/tyrosine-protein kinase catalytic domain-containing protein n=1 Tax=Mugilogobius chulae TaxID=88201 RepID=A0AAW0Q2J7_9GOBI